MNKASQLIISNRYMFVDSQIAQDMSESRAKATAIIKNVISPVYLEELVQLLRVNKFGLLVDETTTIDTKSVMGLRVRFFDSRLQSCFLKLLAYEDGTADGLFTVVVTS